MKRLFITLFAVFLVALSFAQTAPKFSYQAVVRNVSNELVANDSVWVTIQFYNHAVAGDAVYSENHHVSTNRNGLMSLLVGEGENPVGDLSRVTWGDALVRTIITLRGGYTVSDVKPITAVPLACYAEQISLQALEEHLGSTNLVSADALRDTLLRYVTAAGLSDTLVNYVTVPSLTDSLSRYITVAGLSDTLVNYVTVPSLTDSLSRYITAAGLSDTLVNYVTVPSLTDSLSRYVTAAGLSDTLENYVTETALGAIIQSIMMELDELKSVTTTIEEFIVPSVPSNGFELSHSPMANRSVVMYVNGVCISDQSYSVINQHLTYIPHLNGDKLLEPDDRIQIYYHYHR